jgi:ElaB/YqjD/DUF883 family membrane-anchored ribosome-binding protein
MAMDRTRDVTEGARETMRQVQDKVAGSMDDLRDMAETIDGTIREFAREKPILAIACAVAAGFFIGRLAART